MISGLKLIQRGTCTSHSLCYFYLFVFTVKSFYDTYILNFYNVLQATNIIINYKYLVPYTILLTIIYNYSQCYKIDKIFSIN